MYERVFTPIRIGAVEIPNRIVRTAHATRFARDYVNDDLIAYHLERAKGGVGLSIIESTSVHPSSTFSLSARDDGAIAPMRRLVDAVAPTGMKLFTQLWSRRLYGFRGRRRPCPGRSTALPGRYAVGVRPTPDSSYGTRTTANWSRPTARAPPAWKRPGWTESRCWQGQVICSRNSSRPC